MNLACFVKIQFYYSQKTQTAWSFRVSSFPNPVLSQAQLTEANLFRRQMAEDSQEQLEKATEAWNRQHSMYLENKQVRRKTSTEYLLPALTPKKRQTSGMIFLQIIWGHQRWGSSFSSWFLGRLNNARTLLSEPRKSVIKAPLLNNNYCATDTLILKRKETGPQENGDEVF